VADVPEGYKDVPPEDRAKAKVFFDRGRTVAKTGNYDYAIEMYIQGLTLDPDAVEAHQELRDFSLKRKVSGGKPKGMMDGMKLRRPSNDDKKNMLNAELLLAYDPGNTDYMQSLMQNAHRAGYFDTVLWIGPILQKANADDKKPDFNKFIVLRDTYKSLRRWKLATDATHYALRMRPDDMDLTTEVKNLGAMETMHNAGYEKGGSFRDQIRDMDKQARLLTGDKDYADLDAQSAVIAEAEKEAKAEPNDPGKAMRYVEALEKTELPEYENKACEILQEWYDKTKQYRYRQKIGIVQMRQLSRMERGKRAALAAAPTDEALKKDYAEFRKEQLEFECKEFQSASEAYPTDMRLRFEWAKRLFALHQYGDCIPIMQQARNDPKYRFDAGILLGQAFLESGFLDEADDTLGSMIKDYQLQGDPKSKEMYYWRARTLELKHQKPESLAHYSKVAQWDFNYRDVQARIKKLRSA
jgi:tetratricopeptide (TPR) repeat protein